MTEAILTYVLPGRPVSWQRKRIDTRPGRKPRVFTSDKQRAATKAHRLRAIAALREAKLTGWPDADDEYEVEVTAHYPTRVVGDTDRILSLVLDALEGVVYASDRQVSDVVCRRRWKSVEPRTVVIVRRAANG